MHGPQIEGFILRNNFGIKNYQKSKNRNDNLAKTTIKLAYRVYKIEFYGKYRKFGINVNIKKLDPEFNPESGNLTQNKA
jgi:hypothetical protein